MKNKIPSSVESELAWAAGFWDGEGSCLVDRRQNKASDQSLDRAGYQVGTRGGARMYVRLSLGQAHPEPLERFRDAVGCGNINGPYNSERADGRTRQPLWVWQVVGSKARQVVELLLPLVCSQKREQFQRVLTEVAS